MKKILLSIGLLFVVLFISAECYAESRQMIGNMVCCRSVDSTVRINKWLTEGDRAAVVKEVMSGECQMISAGTIVFVEKHGFEWAEIRQKGSTISVWTLEKNLK